MATQRNQQKEAWARHRMMETLVWPIQKGNSSSKSMLNTSAKFKRGRHKGDRKNSIHWTENYYITSPFFSELIAFDVM